MHSGTLGLMATLFDGQLGAFSYVLFVLLYMPCVATLGAIYKELGGFWAFFSATWNTVIAYTLAVTVYQAGTFAAHPVVVRQLLLGRSVRPGARWVRGACARAWGGPGI